MNKSQKNEATFGQGLEMAQLAIKAIANARKQTRINNQQFQKIMRDPGEVYDYFLDLFKKHLDTGCLRYLKTIEIGDSNGERLICNSSGVFKSYIDNDFLLPNLTEKSSKKAAGKVDVYELYRDVPSKQFVYSLERPLEEIVFTQDQIIEICANNRSDLGQAGCVNIFIIKKNPAKLATINNLLLAWVDVSVDELMVGVSELRRTIDSIFLPRLFVPAPENF